jgi:Xaa-Pro aminopeptidase
MSDLSCGTNTNSGGGMPTNKVIESGDLVLSDFQPCLQGYWGDSCNTIVVGTAIAEKREIFDLVKDGLEMGIRAIRPGVQANEIDWLMRKHIGSYPHHSGHGVGTAYHEGPRITPYNETRLEPGMIIALEPAVYKENYGIRLEHLMLVTETGSEQLTQFKHRFEQ